MSRIGKLPIDLPAGVKAIVEGSLLRVEGPKGKLVQNIPAEVDVVIEGSKILLKRKIETAKARASHGLSRAVLANIVKGVSQGFERKLTIVGVGYRAAVKGNQLGLTLGFSHPVDFDLPLGIKAVVEGNTNLTIQGADKALVGEVCAKIRSIRPPEPYKGKGVRYKDEHIRKKVGKAAGK